MRTSCRFAMAVHVLAVLGYKQGDHVTSSLLASSVNTNPVVIRRLLLALQAARLVETRKGGTGGGTRLSRSPGSNLWLSWIAPLLLLLVATVCNATGQAVSPPGPV